MDPFADPFADDESKDARSATGKLKNFGETGPMDAAEVNPAGAKKKPKLENFGETDGIEQPDYDAVAETTDLPRSALKNFGETDGIAQPDYDAEAEADASDTTNLPRSELKNFGETDGIADPFADSAGVIQEPPSARSNLRPDDNEENVFAIVGDEPEPDSQAPFMRQKEGDETVDLPGTDLEKLKTPSFVKGAGGGGGSEALTMNKGRDVFAGDATDDLREVAEPPPLGESMREDDTGEASRPSLGEASTGAIAADDTADEHDDEPDFLYGEKFADKYKVAEGPPPKPSKLPQIVAGVGGFLLVAVIVVVIYKFSSGPRPELIPTPPVNVTSQPAPTRPTPGDARPIAVPVKPPPAPSGSSSVIKPTKPADEPPSLPPPTDEIEEKLRRALGWGLPIGPTQAAPKAGAPGEGGKK
jgi:hypothetical protein